jgi:hypothetical protein
MFELTQLHRYGRLGQVQPLRGSRDAAFSPHGGQDLELPDCQMSSQDKEI